VQLRSIIINIISLNTWALKQQKSYIRSFLKPLSLGNKLGNWANVLEKKEMAALKTSVHGCEYAELTFSNNDKCLSCWGN